MGAATLSFCHSWTVFKGASETIGAIPVAPQSPILGRSTTGSLICFFHNPSGGAENVFVANSRRLRRDSSDMFAKIGAVALGFLHHKRVVVSETGGGVTMMPLTGHNAVGSFLRHNFGFWKTVTDEDFQSGPSIEIMVKFSVFLVVRTDCAEILEKRVFAVEPSLDQSFVSELVVGSFKVGVVFVFSRDQSRLFFVPGFGSGRQSSRGLTDLEATHIWPVACRDAKESGGISEIRLFTFDRDGTGDAGMAVGVTTISGLSCFCHRRRWVVAGVMIDEPRTG